VRTLYRDDREQVNLATHLGDLDDGGETRQATTYYNDFRSCHAV
jgi:hypothetical protein